MTEPLSLETLLKRDRLILFIGLLAISLLAWGYLIYDARHLSCRALMAPSGTPGATGSAFALGWLFLMWVVMMIAMMVPSVAPTLLMFAAVNRQRRQQRRPFVPTGVFLLGYLAVWSLFSLLASVLQQGLHATAVLSSAMVMSSPFIGGGLLLAAGLFQWMPLKRACLVHCRTPLSFLMTEWREGMGGAFLMGMRHGAYCLGCCWILMGLLFVAGVMNLLWVAAISLLVLVEKSAPAGQRVSWAAGFLLIGWGVWIAARALPAH